MNYKDLDNGSDAIGNGEVDSSILSGSTSPSGVRQQPIRP
jgi:hypothetical protein